MNITMRRRVASDAIRPTRFHGIGYRQDGPTLWRFYDTDGDRPAAVGPHYRTKAELLADCDRYCTEYGADAVPTVLKIGG
jgi:hypothetical protein